jgi:hydroxymethylbilane synthase
MVLQARNHLLSPHSLHLARDAGHGHHHRVVCADEPARSSTDWIRQRLDPRDFCPAAGQGCLAIETRENDAATRDAVGFLDHADTRFAVTAERAALAALGGGCQVPIGVHCRPVLEPEAAAESDEIFAVVAHPETGEVVRVHHRAAREEGGAVALGQLAAKMLIDRGAGPLLALAAGSAQ